MSTAAESDEDAPDSDVSFDGGSDGERNCKSKSCSGDFVASEDVSSQHLGWQPFSHCETAQEPNHDAFGRAVPKNRTAWRISHDHSYVNYNAFTGEVIPSPVKKYPVVELPEELVPTVEDMHCPELQRRGEVVEELFFETRNRYMYGDLYEKEPEIWKVLWEPSRLKELTTLTVQSTICAALNSRKRLAFIIGVTLDKKIIGCQLSTEQINKMKELFELCITSEFVPALDEGLAHFYFYPVYDQSGHEIPSRFVVEIAVRDAVTTLYQLSSGRVYYVSGDAVACTKSFDEAIRMLFRRRQAEFKAALEDPEQKQKWAPCPRDPDDDWEGSKLLSFSNLLWFGVSGLIFGLIAYDYLPSISPKLELMGKSA